MGKANFTDDFNSDAVLRKAERGHSVAELTARLENRQRGSGLQRNDRGQAC